MAKKRVNIFGEEVKKREKTVGPVLLYVILYIITLFAGVLSAQASQIEIEVGAICEHTIMAPYDFTDEYSTDLLRQEAVQKVLPVYTTDSDAETASIGQIQSDFASLEEVRSYSMQLYTSLTENYQGVYIPETVNWEGVLTQGDIDVLLHNMSDYMKSQDIYVAAGMTQDALADLKATVVTAVTDAYAEGIISDDIQTTSASILEDIARSGKFSDAQIDTVETILSNSIQANRIYNKIGTDAAKEEAAAAVEPVMYKKGENIIRQGDRITQKQYEIISQLGLSKDTNTMLPRWIAGAILAGVIILVWIIYVMMSDRTLLTNFKKAFSIFLLSVVTIGIELICKSISSWIIPVYLAAIVSSALLRPRSAIVYSAFISLLSAFVLSPSDSFFFSETTLIVLFSGILGSAAVVLSLKDKLHRSEYVLSGLIAGAINAMIYIAYGVMNDYTIVTYFYMSIIGLANGLVCGLLSVGLLPIWEALFSLDTPSKLLEIASPDSDLLKRMMAYAPGTYHHSVMVSNLAEA
ncbi:MAG: hypothetical protein IKK29_02390, partial [Christensenellaceae bacterium]|nr:hypothetical protein [Christensenellaceae bacterium]